MRGKEIITKLIIPGAIAMIICLIVHPMCMNGEIGPMSRFSTN